MDLEDNDEIIYVCTGCGEEFTSLSAPLGGYHDHNCPGNNRGYEIKERDE